VAFFDGGVDGTGGEAVLDTYDEFLDRGKKTGNPLRDVEEDMVGMVADETTVPGLFWWTSGFGGLSARQTMAFFM
jgi:hypothetical protein